MKPLATFAITMTVRSGSTVRKPSWRLAAELSARAALSSSRKRAEKKEENEKRKRKKTWAGKKLTYFTTSDIWFCPSSLKLSFKCSTKLLLSICYISGMVHDTWDPTVIQTATNAPHSILVEEDRIIQTHSQTEKMPAVRTMWSGKISSRVWIWLGDCIILVLKKGFSEEVTFKWRMHLQE